MEGLSKEVEILGDKVKIAETNAETMKGRFGEGLPNLQQI